MKERSRIDHAQWSNTALIILLVGGAQLLLGQRTLGLELPPPPDQALTLDQSVQQALVRSPGLRAAEARLREAQGRLTGAETYPHNPVLEGEAAARDGADRSGTDFQVALGQEIEIAGQRGARIDTTQAELSAERASLARTKQLVAAHVHLAFVTALEGRELLVVARSDVQLAERLFQLAERRLERGAGTQLDVNVAAAELGRAEGHFQAAEADYQRARAALAEAMGLEPAFLPLPLGSLEANLHALPSLEEVLESARARRADLQALRDLEGASRTHHELARSEGWPNLTVRLFGGREEGTDRIIGGGLSFPLPLFNRNQGAIERTRAAIQRAQAERLAGEISIDREVVAAHARYRAGINTAQKLRRLVFGTLAQTLELLQRSFEAGKATWPEVIVIRRTLVEAQRELTAAEAEARRAWTELQLATGRMPLPDPNSAEEAR